MATRSTIAVLHEDGTISQIYCHWDGYLDHNGKILKENYDTIEKVEALVSLGAISSLAPSMEAPEGHSWGKPVKGYTVFYARDRDEDMTDVGPRKFASQVEYLHKAEREEYNYLFRDGKWFCDGMEF